MRKYSKKYFKENFTYKEENIPNNKVIKEKIRNMVVKIEKEKLYGSTPPPIL